MFVQYWRDDGCNGRN